MILWFCTYFIDLDSIKDDKFVTASIFFYMKHLKNASLELYVPSQFQIQGNISPISSGGMGSIKMRNLRMERRSVRVRMGNFPYTTGQISA